MLIIYRAVRVALPIVVAFLGAQAQAASSAKQAPIEAYIKEPMPAGIQVVGTEVDGGWSRRVLLDPAAVEHLESFRASVGVPFSPTSGFRSPRHQESTCLGICGATYCPGKCARTSRHMHGDAFDLPVTFYSYKYASTACDSGFHFAYDEAHNHLHVDDNPQYSTCVIQFD